MKKIKIGENAYIEPADAIKLASEKTKIKKIKKQEIIFLAFFIFISFALIHYFKVA